MRHRGRPFVRGRDSGIMGAHARPGTRIPMSGAETLPDLLRHAARSAGGVTYLDGAHAERRVAYRDLERRALNLLHHLQAAGAEPNRPVILLLTSNEAFVDAFWACQLGGLIPVPVAVANTPGNRLKLFRIWETLDRPLLCTVQAVLDRYATFARVAGEEERFDAMDRAAVRLDRITDAHRTGQVRSRTPGDIALIQFSSGSTRTPKGVVLTHRNLLTNVAAIAACIRLGKSDVTFSWMPMTHDMGLIGFHLTPLACAIDHCLMATESFVRRPLLWLRQAAAHRATVLSSPNFGYRHLLKALGNDSPDADLSAVRLIVNGAEPISAALCHEFLERMAPCGLRPGTMFPVYGLAEASLGVTSPEPGAPLRVHHVDRHSLGVGLPVRVCGESDPAALSLVGVGSPNRDCEIAIRDHDEAALPEGVTGRILVRGDNVTAGYHVAGGGRDRSAFSADGWLDTGDLGFLSDGELFVAGRAKEIIFVNGRNLFPHDVEALLHEHAGLEPGRVAACGAPADDAQDGQLLVFVVFRGAVEDFAPLARRVRRTLSEQLGLAATQAIPVARIPKTTSGKIQRYRLAERYRTGEFTQLLERIERLPTTGTDAGITDIERRLLEICTACIPGTTIGRDDNLFELGTGSLTLAQIYEQVEARYPGALEITDFFDHPTVAHLAAHLRDRCETADAPQEVTVK